MKSGDSDEAGALPRFKFYLGFNIFVALSNFATCPSLDMSCCINCGCLDALRLGKILRNSLSASPSGGIAFRISSGLGISGRTSGDPARCGGDAESPLARLAFAPSDTAPASVSVSEPALRDLFFLPKASTGEVGLEGPGVG
jgi:hypothetical protein